MQRFHILQSISLHSVCIISLFLSSFVWSLEKCYLLDAKAWWRGRRCMSSESLQLPGLTFNTKEHKKRRSDPCSAKWNDLCKTHMCSVKRHMRDERNAKANHQFRVPLRATYECYAGFVCVVCYKWGTVHKPGRMLTKEGFKPHTNFKNHVTNWQVPCVVHIECFFVGKKK